MRTFTTKHTVYTFDELTDEARQKAIDKYNENNDLPFLSDDMREQLTEVLLPKYKMTCDNAEVFYSLSYCQGDGAMFEGTIYWRAWRVEVRQTGHYFHEYSKTFDGESVNTGKEMPEATEAVFNDLYVEICQELEKYGYAEIEYQQSKEGVAEMFEANGYEFNKDGTIQS